LPQRRRFLCFAAISGPGNKELTELRLAGFEVIGVIEACHLLIFKRQPALCSSNFHTHTRDCKFEITTKSQT
jgi:hypothetical protein